MGLLAAIVLHRRVGCRFLRRLCFVAFCEGGLCSAVDLIGLNYDDDPICISDSRLTAGGRRIKIPRAGHGGASKGGRPQHFAARRKGRTTKDFARQKPNEGWTPLSGVVGGFRA
ncbi:unnamed protein product, partial [Iphiclides podalirius]